jgi:hypothetical protein
MRWIFFAIGLAALFFGARSFLGIGQDPKPTPAPTFETIPVANANQMELVQPNNNVQDLPSIGEFNKDQSDAYYTLQEAERIKTLTHIQFCDQNPYDSSCIPDTVNIQPVNQPSGSDPSDMTTELLFLGGCLILIAIYLFK